MSGEPSGKASAGGSTSTPRTWGMVKVVHATLLEIQGEWAADIGPERFGDFMTALRRFAALGCEAN